MQYSRTVSQTKHFHSYATRNEVNTSCKVKCSCNRTASYNYSKIVCMNNRRRVIILKDCNRKECSSLVTSSRLGVWAIQQKSYTRRRFQVCFLSYLPVNFQNTNRPHFSLFNTARDHENDDMKNVPVEPLLSGWWFQLIKQTLLRRFPWST